MVRPDHTTTMVSPAYRGWRLHSPHARPPPKPLPLTLPRGLVDHAMQKGNRCVVGHGESPATNGCRHSPIARRLPRPLQMMLSTTASSPSDSSQIGLKAWLTGPRKKLLVSFLETGKIWSTFFPYPLLPINNPEQMDGFFSQLRPK